ncbi:carboxypeptidase regulatory-like domain-containing protein [Streptomyces longwoodensis]|uniref:MSCRAMM family protein n=1 Tax=Streptomyces longwoodensis TaxID=68231 RepID=UPI0036EF69EC
MSPAQTRPAEAGEPVVGGRAALVVAVLAFGGIVVSLMQTLVIPIVPELPRLLHASAWDAGRAALPSENGFRTVMAIGSGAAVLALVVAAFIPRRGRATARGVTDPTVAPAAQAPTSAHAISTDEAGRGAVQTDEERAGTAAGTESPERAVGSAVAVPLARAVAELVATVPGLTEGGRAGGHPVRGHVRGGGNAPVAGAAVTLISLAGRQLDRAVADTRGAYAVEAPGEGTYVLIAAADGHRPQATTIVVGADPVTHDVLLGSTGGLAGTVRSADGGAPVAGAVVIVTDVRGDVLATTRTDGLGAYAFTDLVPGPVTLAVSSPKHRPLALSVEMAGTGTTRADVELRPGAQVRGTVRAAGGPLGDARVTLVDAAGNVVATTTTGPDGAYAFSDLDTGAYTVIATGYPPRATGIHVGGDVDGHDIALAHAGG